MRLARHFVPTLFLLLSAIAGQAFAAGPAPPGVPCAVAADVRWSATEAWVWGQICVGRVADLSKRDGTRLDPATPEIWPTARRLGPAFLESVLLHEPWREALPRQGVRIVGALFDAPIDLTEARLEKQLWLDDCVFLQPVAFESIRGPTHLSFEGSHFAGDLDLELAKIDDQLNLAGVRVQGALVLDSAMVGGDLFLSRGRFAMVDLGRIQVHRTLELSEARIDGALELGFSRIGGELRASGARLGTVEAIGLKVGEVLDLSVTNVAGQLVLISADIGTALHIPQVVLTAVDLRRIKVGAELNLAETQVTGDLNLTSATIGSDLQMPRGSVYGQLNLSSAGIGSDLTLAGADLSGVQLADVDVGGSVFLSFATVAGEIVLDAGTIGSDLWLRRGTFKNKVDIFFTRIGTALVLEGAELAQLNLHGSRIEGELNLGQKGAPASWGEKSRFSLRNTSVDALQEVKAAWPPELDLDGFTYRRLGGFGADDEVANVPERLDDYIAWLAKDEPYTPQPYQQLAAVFRDMGHGEEANAILYAGRERARERAWKDGNYPSWFGQTLLKLTIGYGYGDRYFRALFWVGGLVLVGVVVLWASGQARVPAADDRPAMILGPFYCLDMLLPIIELRQRHYDIDLHGAARYYFYFHKLMGYVLASFLIAGLSGLTN